VTRASTTLFYESKSSHDLDLNRGITAPIILTKSLPIGGE
jgi:hypothetical protein